MFQAVVAAIHQSVREVGKWWNKLLATKFHCIRRTFPWPRYHHQFSFTAGDSVAIEKYRVTDRQHLRRSTQQVLTISWFGIVYVSALSEVSIHRKFILTCLSNHTDVRRNEAADELTRWSPLRIFVGTVSSFHITKSTKSFDEWIHRKFKECPCLHIWKRIINPLVFPDWCSWLRNVVCYLYT